MGSYGRLLKFISVIKAEVVAKALINLLISATYIIQAFSMAKAVTVVFQGNGLDRVLPFALIALVCISPA